MSAVEKLAGEGARRSPYFTEEHEALRDQVRRFVETEIKPHALKWEEDGLVPRDVLRKMGDLGFFGIRYPAEYGGSEMDTLATVVLAEELGRSTFSGVAITALVHTDMASVHIANAGSKAQKDKYLPGIIAGETIVAVAVTEPDAGSDVKGIRTTARREGDHYILNGAKMFITNGVHADLYCVAAKTDPQGRPSQSVSIFIVEKGTPGFSVSRALDKHGWRSSDTAELSFVDCKVPAENLLGQEGRGFYAIMSNFQNERTVIGAMAIGESQAAIDLTLDYVKTRKAFGAPLWEKQAIRQRLAELAGKVEAGRQLVYHAAWLDAQGFDATREVSMVKAYCGELVNEVMYDCLQFHGGMGYMRESAIERMTRDARVQSIGGGATEVMLEEVAKRL
ncbi:MAG: acyl-CoA dehydrogenase family protein [Bosea sp. (in: a-proteobacteria)]|uniref:acyl-CoA dehydrogenase family protein n=1 Tax=unclassified Bosea (in: a-proteobacteria) TaxID=2653178 RepID=UPI000968765F|nr:MULTISPECIES: acyl-CoA dehydrogenase family protein [unclassified Bosea (in: a-proteobacteria)]MBN9441795.1 acyl-CoA dehydrogenase family protein [Bosea sp. (in: a-proteobacteria)]MBN9458643.1 acyl-CoA dehydrogenase family protein [Bosea sp. (in: a-proteobacteria)]OJV06692.1 MAG: acyl-CoA dehydrogenase [Bosea sp. 67-29]